MSSLLKDEDPGSRMLYDDHKLKDYEKLAEDSFKAELDETVKLESDKILSGVKSEDALLYQPATTSAAGSVVSVSHGVSLSAVVAHNPASSSSAAAGTVRLLSTLGSTTDNNHKTLLNTKSASTASIMSQHGNKRLFKCGFCSSTFADTYKLERHVKSEHRDITDRAKYETFPWQEPGGSGNTSSSKSSSSHRSRIHAPRTLLVDPSQTTFSSNMGHKTISHHQHHPHHIAATTALQPLPPPPQQQPLSASNGLKLKMEPAGLDLDASLVSSEYFLCQVCSKIFVSYKDFSLHMNESPACKNVGGEVLCGEEEEDHGGFSSNDVLVILSPEDSLKFAGEAILESVVEAAASAGPNEIMTQQAVYECQLCRALFASADYLKKHLELCQTSAPKRRKT